MSDTPRVDRELSRLGRVFDNGSIRYRQAEAASMRDLARQLEQELTEARAEIERRNNAHNLLFATFSSLREEHEILKVELADARAEIERLKGASR